MENPEFLVVVVNAIIIAIAYFLIYPKFCGANGYKVAINDVLATGLALLIIGLNYWDSGTGFNILFTTLNWFWFTLITYLVIELPLMLWYFKKHDVWSTFNS